MPWPERNLDDWKSEILQDMGLIAMHIKELEADTLDTEEVKLKLASAYKEAQRLQSDIRRIGSEVYGLELHQIQEVLSYGYKPPTREQDSTRRGDSEGQS